MQTIVVFAEAARECRLVGSGESSGEIGPRGRYMMTGRFTLGSWGG